MACRQSKNAAADPPRAYATALRSPVAFSQRRAATTCLVVCRSRQRGNARGGGRSLVRWWHTRGMVEVWRNDYYVIEADTARRLIFLRRTTTPFPSLEEMAEAHRAADVPLAAHRG